MKNCLIITFDYHRENDLPVSFAVANIMAYIQASISNDQQVTKAFSFNMYHPSDLLTSQLDLLLQMYDLTEFHVIAISLYCWCREFVNPLISVVKYINPTALVVLGGYEVNLNDEKMLVSEFPSCDIFIAGHAEASMVSLVKGDQVNHKFMNINFDINNLPNIYESEILRINYSDKLRFESKRGCIFSCTFCAHRDIVNNALIEKEPKVVIKELEYLNSIEFAKLNFVDPTYNTGRTYLKILDAMVKMKFRHKVSFQTRFELIKGEEGYQFLELVQKLNCILEFGLQTINYDESVVINRVNDIDRVVEIIDELNRRSIIYSVSLIYGLPKQTLDSFKASIEFLQKHHCKNIECNPLMLIKGTNLYYEKDLYNLVEEKINGIDYVTSSNSFSREDYNQMQLVAQRYSNACL